jgi:hypothetical protein
LHPPCAELSDIKRRAGKAGILADVRTHRYQSRGNGLFIVGNNKMAWEPGFAVMSAFRRAQGAYPATGNISCLLRARIRRDVGGKPNFWLAEIPPPAFARGEGVKTATGNAGCLLPFLPHQIGAGAEGDV